MFGLNVLKTRATEAVLMELESVQLLKGFC